MKYSFKNLLSNEKHFVGTFIQTGSPEFLEAGAYAGFKFAVIDLEHTYYGMEKTAELIRAGEAAGLSMLVRIPCLDSVIIKKALDFGVAGIIAPNIDTASQAVELVDMCRFSPSGKRGACPGVRANCYGKGGSEYYDIQDNETAVIALIESPEGVSNFNDIIKVEGLTSVFLGPVDLSVSMCLKGNAQAPEVQSALLDMIKKANEAKIPVGALGLSPEFIKSMFSAGLDYVAYGIDTILMYQKCKEIMDSLNL